MYLLISISLAIIPALLLVVYFYRRDHLKPEPRELILKIFFLGILSTIPIIILELTLALFDDVFSFHPLAGYAFRAFIIAALCEEGFKFIIVKQFAYNRVEFDEVMDGIVYTIVASLGFAVVENMLYVIRTGIVVALLRAVTAVPLHALASGLMGYYLGVAKFITDKTSERKLFIKGLGLAILVHGLYNFFLFSVEFFGGWIALGIIPVLLLSGIFLQNKIKKALSSDLEMGRVI